VRNPPSPASLDPTASRRRKDDADQEREARAQADLGSLDLDGLVLDGDGLDCADSDLQTIHSLLASTAITAMPAACRLPPAACLRGSDL
jgi:hypothetical protein